MIKEAIEKSRGLDIAFEVKSVEELNYRDCFNVIFCNSSTQRKLGFASIILFPMV